MAFALRGKNGDLFLRFHITVLCLDGETVHLRFRERVGSPELDRILRRDDKEQIGQNTLFAFDADLTFTHGFKQRGLRARRSAIYFVREENVRENRTLMEVERAVPLI